MNKYIEAKNICLPALREFRNDINDHLPDTLGETDYLIDWQLEDCEYVQKCINRTAEIILSTCMADHNSYELHNLMSEYVTAIKNKDIRKCQLLLEKALEIFNMIRIALKAIRE